MNKICEIKVSYSTNLEERITISRSFEIYNALLNYWNKDTIELHEEFKVLLLNRANQVLGIYNHSKGGVSSTVVDAKLILSVALKCNATSIILAHNHPSGNKKPSVSDEIITKSIKEGCSYLSIKLLDHIIVTKDGYFSFADAGLV